MRAVDGRQLRAGRAILGWTVVQVAEAAGIHRNSVVRTEAVATLPIHAWAADRISDALEANGVVFDTDDNGPVVSFNAVPRRLPRRLLKARVA